MSILIKGMEMPKSCAECFVAWEKCHRTVEWYKNNPQYYDIRHEDCPLIELPPHGRLIDADAVYKVIKEDEEWVASNFGDEEQTLLLGYQCAYGRSRRMIRHAPTIIESEGEE